MRSLKQLIHVTLVLLPLQAHAIVAVGESTIGQPPEGVHATVDLLANGERGNTETSQTKMNLVTFWKHQQHTELLKLQYAYGKSGGIVDTDRAFAHLRERTDISQSWAVEAFAQVSRDPFARIARRTLLGGGMRNVLFEEDNKSAGYLGLGAFHEQERLSETLGTNDALREDLWRASTYLVLKGRLNEQVRVYSTTYYQPAFKDTRDYRALEQASMLVKLADKLDLKVSLDIAFDSQPPQTVQQRDMAYSTGLEYSF